MAYVIFDLDGTVINSDHRHSTKADGSIDLKHWFDNAKPEKIAADTLLPLARSMQAIKAAGHFVIVCTSRCFQAADHQYLADNGLVHDVLFSRPGYFVGPDSWEYENSYHGFVGDDRSDEIIKAEQLETFFRGRGFHCAADANALMFDDNLRVIDKMNAIGITCLNAKNVNARMRAYGT